ncbi:hypothetical protein Tco_1313134 [Tanacetum coccineum]
MIDGKHRVEGSSHQPVNALPTALSPSYVADSDPLEEDPEEDPANYPTDEGDDEEESSKDDEEEKEAS